MLFLSPQILSAHNLSLRNKKSRMKLEVEKVLNLMNPLFDNPKF